MNNAQIILNESLALLENGLINTTGRVITFKRNDGTEASVPEPEPIHTFNGWKAYGRQIKKGEHAVAKFPIWKYTSKKETIDAKNDAGEAVSIETENANMFLKTSFFFTFAQTEPLKEGHK